MKTTAAVLIELGKPLVLAELDIPVLKPGQVLVQIAFSGICHTQILECRGYRGEDRYLPHCLGHEGSGVVQDVGPGVTKVKAGDRVILSWIKGSGANVPRTVYQWGSRTVNAGGITTFGRHSVISENRLTVIPGDISMREAAFLGCAVPTGVGVVFNTAQPRSGQSIAIFGTGGIGLCAVAGATIAGCTPIIAVDIQYNKLMLARQMGATHCIHAAEVDPVEKVKQVCPNGVDFAIEASGRPEVMLQALYSVRDQGGVAVVVGNARHGEQVELDPKQLNLGKQLRGTWGGDNSPDRDFPRYCRLLSSGKLNLDPLLSKIYRLSEINDAIDDLEAGQVVRPLIDMAME
ncbi:MAG: alcohol dehydrogenase [Deltaproteobacteria bacterium]|nr:MAG: alcohol dehydrogenase [Deltaproteobacteria bacterium]